MDTINLKFGETQEPLPKKTLDRFCKEAFRDVNLYPRNYDALISRLAQKHGIKGENIVLTNGADEAIELISRIFGKDILIFSPTYYEFLDAPKRNNLECEMIDCFDGKDCILKYDEEQVKNRSLIFLCNPNNPFGVLTKKEITNLARKTNGVVAVDETYIDFDGESVINEFENTPNILVLRSFSKGYSLAGFRIGYIVAEKFLIEKIKKRKLIFNVSSVSVNAAMIVLDEEKYFKGLVKRIKERKAKFEVFLKKTGFKIIESKTNKVLIKFLSIKEAREFHDFLAQNNILVTLGNGLGTCGLDNSFIQFDCGTKEQMGQVAKIIKRYKMRRE